MANGQTSVLQADKYKLTAQLGIQMRDLRLLDPQVRDHALRHFHTLTLRQPAFFISPHTHTSILCARQHPVRHTYLGLCVSVSVYACARQMTNTYPSAILCRDKAIVVNLEHIKVIITMDRVLVVNYEDESNAKVCSRVCACLYVGVCV